MNTQEEKLRLLYEAINEYADNQRVKILYDSEKESGELLEQAEKEALNEAYAQLCKETAAVRSELKGELAKREFDSRRALLVKREELEDRVFAECAEKLREFAESGDYSVYLLRAFNSAKKALGTKRLRIHLRPADMKYSSLFEGCELIGDESIDIGGLKAGCEGKAVLVNLTLDDRLSSQRGYFRAVSGLELGE